MALFTWVSHLLRRPRQWDGALLCTIDHAREAALVNDSDVFAAPPLADVILGTERPGTLKPKPSDASLLDPDPSNYFHDPADYCGPCGAKLAVKVATKREHNVLLIGPDGTGTTMMELKELTVYHFMREVQ